MLEEIAVSFLAAFSKKSPLHIAAERGYLKVLRDLLNNPAINIDLPDSEGRTALHLATIGNHEEAVKFLLNAQADTQVITKDGFQSLHFAALTDNPTIVKLFLKPELNIPVDKTSLPGQLTFLDTVVKYNSFNLIEMLLEEGSVNFESMLQVALRFKNTKVIKYLLDENPLHASELTEKAKTFLRLNAIETALYADGHNTAKFSRLIDDESRSIYERASAFFELLRWKLQVFTAPKFSYTISADDMESFWKTRKTLIKTQLPLESIAEEVKPSPRVAICSQAFYEEPDFEHATTLQQRIDECSNMAAAPVIAPFIYLLALAAIGKCSQEQQKLKILLIHSTDLTGIKGPSYFGIKGRYNFEKYTLFSSTAPDTANPNTPRSMGNVFHEAAHFAVQLIKEADCKPYKPEDISAGKSYLSIVKEIKRDCVTWKFNDPAEYQVIASFKSIFNSYKKSEHEAELFVKIAETIGFLGYERGCAWLKIHTPSLLAFYEDHFNPACIAYLKAHEVWEHIALDAASEEMIRKSTLTETKFDAEMAYTDDNDNSQYCSSPFLSSKNDCQTIPASSPAPKVSKKPF